MIKIGKVRKAKPGEKVFDLESTFDEISSGKDEAWYESYILTAKDLSDRGYEVYVTDNDRVKPYLEKHAGMNFSKKKEAEVVKDEHDE